MSQQRYEILAEKLQVKGFFYIEYIVLYMFGFDLNSKEKPFYRFWFSAGAFLTLGFIMICTVHYLYFNMHELDMVTDALVPFVQALMVGSKFIILMQRRNEIIDIVHRIWDLTEIANEAEVKTLTYENKRATRLSMIYTRIILLTVVIAVFSPLVVGTYSYLVNGEFVYQVVFTATYPLKMEDPVNYPIIYLLNMYALYGGVSVIVGMDTVFSWCAHNIAAQFRVLQQKMRLLSQCNGTDSNGIDVRASIVDCIRCHQRVIELSDALDRFLRPVAFVEFSLNSTQICCIAYQLGKNPDMSRVLFLFSFLLTVLMQLLLYSHGGQRIEDESENVAVAAYDGIQWEFWSTSERKMLLLIILRAQRSCKMTAVFFYMNMGSFVTVLRTAASYITLLRSVSSSQDTLQIGTI